MNMDYPYIMKVTRAIYRDAGFGPESLVKKLTFLESVYDNAGRLLSEKRYDDYGDLEAETSNEYDAAGNLILKQEFDSSGEFTEKIACAYNEAGQLTERKIYYIDNTFDSEIYLYDKDGHNTEIRNTDEEGLPESSVLKTYHEGNLVAQVRLDADGNEESSRKIQYNTHGNPLAIEEWTDEGYTLTRITYDENQGVVRREVFGEDGDLSASWEKLSPGADFSMAYLESSGGQDVKYLIRNDAGGNEILRQAYDGEGNLLMEVVREYRDDLLVCQKIHVTGYPAQHPQYYAYSYSYEAL